MVRRDEDALASLLLTNRLTETTVKPLTPSEYWSLVETIANPGRLLGLDAVASTGVIEGNAEQAERIVALLGAGTEFAFELERLEQAGFTALTPFDSGYPGRLRGSLKAVAPPVLISAGPASLLAQDGVGVVGSRDASPAAVEITRRVAGVAAQRGLTVISGGARGIDRQAMDAAYEADGTVVGVLADSLLRRVRDSETRRVIGEGKACLLTQYKPDAGFSVANAMGRNKIIYALANVTLVVECSEGSGGSWQGATEALKRRYGRVAVWLGEQAGPGNHKLAELGAEPVEDPDDDSWMAVEMISPEAAQPEQLKIVN